MKLICDCGNEDDFNTIDEETENQTTFIQDEGQYATINNFRFWEAHDMVGLVCERCKKAIWLFT